MARRLGWPTATTRPRLARMERPSPRPSPRGLAVKERREQTLATVAAGSSRLGAGLAPLVQTLRFRCPRGFWRADASLASLAGPQEAESSRRRWLSQ